MIKRFYQGNQTRAETNIVGKHIFNELLKRSKYRKECPVARKNKALQRKIDQLQ